MSALDTLKQSIQHNLTKLSISTTGGEMTQSIVVDGSLDSTAVFVDGTEVQNLPLSDYSVSSTSLDDELELGQLPAVTSCLVKITWQDELGNVLDTFNNICALNNTYTFVPDIDFNVWDETSATIQRKITGALTETIMVVHAKFPLQIRYRYCGEVVYTETRNVYIGERLVMMHGYTTWSEKSPYKQVGYDSFAKTITSQDLEKGLDVMCTDYREVELYKVDSWTQPKLTGTTTTVTEGTITCTASSAYVNSGVEDNAAWHAMDGIGSGYANSTYWGPGTYGGTGNANTPDNFGACWQVKFPYKLLIKKITVSNRFTTGENEQTSLSGAFYTNSSKKKMIGKPFTNSHRAIWWKTPIGGIDQQGVATDTIYFFKENSDDWAGIGEIEIEADKLTTSNVSQFEFEYVVKQY